MIPRLWGKNCKFFKTPLSCNSQKRLEQEENQTKYRKMTRKPLTHVRIFIYRTWVITRTPMLSLTAPTNYEEEAFNS